MFDNLFQRKKEVSIVNLWTSFEVHSMVFSKKNIGIMIKIIEENHRFIKNDTVRRDTLYFLNVPLNYKKSELNLFFKRLIPNQIKNLDSKNFKQGYSNTELEEFQKLIQCYKNILNQIIEEDSN